MWLLPPSSAPLFYVCFGPWANSSIQDFAVVLLNFFLPFFFILITSILFSLKKSFCPGSEAGLTHDYVSATAGLMAVHLGQEPLQS